MREIYYGRNIPMDDVDFGKPALTVRGDSLVATVPVTDSWVDTQRRGAIKRGPVNGHFGPVQ
ncbi:hypothetical protein ABKU02_23480 [Enterobacter hormaechei]